MALAPAEATKRVSRAVASSEPGAQSAPWEALEDWGAASSPATWRALRPPRPTSWRPHSRLRALTPLRALLEPGPPREGDTSAI